MSKIYDVIVIGGGPAGLAAAISAYDNGASVLLMEREDTLGGILNQCIHNGFGVARFKTSLTGPEYAARFIEELEKRGIEVKMNTAAIALSPRKEITAINDAEGVFTVQAKSVILAMGCRERSRGGLNIAGTRPAGIYSAGTAQKYVNIHGYLVGKRVVILGSGDIGLIMARRMALEGAKVLAVCEIQPYSSGLKRNVVQCLEDFEIPLYLSHTIVKIEGEERVNAVVIAEVDEHRQPIAGTEMRLDCDTVLFSVGLIPENELAKGGGVPLSDGTKGAIVDQTRETLVDGIFSCGNVLQVHDLVDFVSEEAEIAGKYAAEYALRGRAAKDLLSVGVGKNVSYVLPQRIDKRVDGEVKFFFRVKKPMRNCVVKVASGETVLLERAKRAALPGEIETILLSMDKIRAAKEELVIIVEEEEK